MSKATPLRSEDGGGYAYNDYYLDQSDTHGKPWFIESQNESSARIEDFKLTAGERGRMSGSSQGVHSSISAAQNSINDYERSLLRRAEFEAQKRSSQGANNAMKSREVLLEDSGNLQTNPTFVSVHQADCDPSLQSQYLKQLSDEQDEGKHHSSQSLFVWGSNECGQLGLKNGNFGNLKIPYRLDFHQKVKRVACGEQHAALVTFAQQLYVMGSNSHAQLGLGDPLDIVRCTVPTLVQSMAHLSVQSVTCGARHTLALASELIGKRTVHVFAWGDNSRGQTGCGIDDLILEPRIVQFDEECVCVDSMSAGKDHSFFVDTSNWHVYACGDSSHGQLGLGLCHEVVNTPLKVESLSTHRIVEVACGHAHTLAITCEGRVYASGANATGQLGLGHTQSRHSFEMIPELFNILRVGASSHSTAIDREGRLFRWGQAVKGIYLAPLKIASPRPIVIDEVSVGYDFGIVKNRIGEVFTYGVNSCGQLGLGDTEARSTLNSLVSVNQQGTVRQMAAGSNFVLCLIDVAHAEPPVSRFVPNVRVLDSAPTSKPAQGRSNQRTSITEFNEFGKVEMFTVLSEQRTHGPREANDLAQNKLHDRILSQKGFLELKQTCKEYGQMGSDHGTINTAKNVRASHHLHHDFSREFSKENDHQEVPQSLVLQQSRSELAAADVTPPYTHSPFMATRSRMPLNEASGDIVNTSQRLSSFERCNRFKQQPEQFSRCAPADTGALTALEQITLAERLQLKSEFARGRSHSSENARFTETKRERPLSDSAKYKPQEGKSENQGLAETSGRNSSLPPLHQHPLRRSQSPKGKHVHQQLPSFSGHHANEFRSRSILNTPLSRQGQLFQQKQSLENTGQFVSSELPFQITSQDEQQHDHVDRSGQVQDTLNNTRGSHSFHNHAFYRRAPLTNCLQEYVPMEDSQLQTLDAMNATETQEAHFEQTAGSNFLASAKLDGNSIKTNAFLQVVPHFQTSSVEHRQGFDGQRSLRTVSDRNGPPAPQQRTCTEDRSHLNFIPLRDYSGDGHNRTRKLSQQPGKIGGVQRSTQYKRPRSLNNTSFHASAHFAVTPMSQPTPKYTYPQQSQNQAYIMESYFTNQPNTQNTIDSLDNSSTVEQSSRNNRFQPRAELTQGNYMPGQAPFIGRSYEQQSKNPLLPGDCGNCGYHVSHAQIETGNNGYALQTQPAITNNRAKFHSHCPACRREESTSRMVSKVQNWQPSATMNCYPGCSIQHIRSSGACVGIQTMDPSRLKPPELSHLRHPKVKKLRKKYKKLKAESSKSKLEHQSELEKLRLRIHDLQSMIQQKEASERQLSVQKSEGYQALVSKYTKEMTLQSEKLCKVERTLVARESQIKAINKESEAHQQLIKSLDSELSKFSAENQALRKDVVNLTDEVRRLSKERNDFEQSAKLLEEQLCAKERFCADQETSHAHLNKTLENLRVNFEATKQHANKVLVENDRLRVENRAFLESVKVYESQIQNLRAFIDELESNNKELMRFIDNKNMIQANDYKTRVAQLFNSRRSANDNSSLRRPQPVSEEVQRPADAVRVTACSHSPVARQTLLSYQKDLAQSQAVLEAQNSAEQQVLALGVSHQLSPINYDYDSQPVATSSKLLDKHYQTSQQQHCVRRKQSGSREPLSSRLQGSVQSPEARASHQRFASMIELEKKEQEAAKQSLDKVLSRIHGERATSQTTEQYLITKASQLMQRVTQYQRERRSDSQEEVDPRKRLAGTVVAQKAFRSISPVEPNWHKTSFKSPTRSVSTHKRSTLSARASQSLDSLHVQYQKVTELARPTIKSNGNSIVDRLPEQRLLQWKLPDIQNVLASSPGKSRVAKKDRKGETVVSQSQPEARSGTVQSQQRFETFGESEVKVFPRVTSAMLRSQLHNINETLAQLKRNRVHLEGTISHYEADSQHQ